GAVPREAVGGERRRDPRRRLHGPTAARGVARLRGGRARKSVGRGRRSRGTVLRDAPHGPRHGRGHARRAPSSWTRSGWAVEATVAHTSRLSDRGHTRPAAIRGLFR